MALQETFGNSGTPPSWTFEEIARDVGDIDNPEGGGAGEDGHWQDLPSWGSVQVEPEWADANRMDDVFSTWSAGNPLFATGTERDFIKHGWNSGQPFPTRPDPAGAAAVPLPAPGAGAAAVPLPAPGAGAPFAERDGVSLEGFTVVLDESLPFRSAHLPDPDSRAGGAVPGVSALDVPTSASGSVGFSGSGDSPSPGGADLAPIVDITTLVSHPRQAAPQSSPPQSSPPAPWRSLEQPPSFPHQTGTPPVGATRTLTSTEPGSAAREGAPTRRPARRRKTRSQTRTPDSAPVDPWLDLIGDGGSAPPVQETASPAVPAGSSPTDPTSGAMPAPALAPTDSGSIPDPGPPPVAVSGAQPTPFHTPPYPPEAYAAGGYPAPPYPAIAPPTPGTYPAHPYPVSLNPVAGVYPAPPYPAPPYPATGAYPAAGAYPYAFPYPYALHLPSPSPYVAMPLPVAYMPAAEPPVAFERPVDPNPAGAPDPAPPAVTPAISAAPPAPAAPTAPSVAGRTEPDLADASTGMREASPVAPCPDDHDRPEPALAGGSAETEPSGIVGEHVSPTGYVALLEPAVVGDGARSPAMVLPHPDDGLDPAGSTAGADAPLDDPFIVISSSTYMIEFADPYTVCVEAAGEVIGGEPWQEDTSPLPQLYAMVAGQVRLTEGNVVELEPEQVDIPEPTIYGWVDGPSEPEIDPDGSEAGAGRDPVRINGWTVVSASNDILPSGVPTEKKRGRRRR